MTTRLLINATVADELRVAVVEDGELIDLDIEAAERGTIKGNIYKGVVHNVEGSLEAAFINFGHHKQGFLPFSEIAPSQYNRKWEKGESPRINDVLKRGQDIIVQVAKDAVGEKGAALTTYLSLPGRFTVLMPGSDARGISRKIDDDTARKKIKQIAEKMEVPEGCGYIIRTAGLGQAKASIQNDLDRLAELKRKIERTADIARAPSLLHAEPDLISRTLRDLVNDEIDEVWIDNREEFEAAKSYFEELMPEFLERLHHFQNPIPIFSYYRVEEQIEEAFERRIPLPSGGSIVVDETEALVAIDVNSGKGTRERDHEDTVYMTNFEAAQVIARQLRLRDLGGIVVIDFIDMELKRNQRAVEKALKDALRTDRARVKMSRILSNGLCILTRQRIRPGIKRSFQRRCTVCQGTGWLRSPESHSLSLLKRIETRLAQGGVEEVRVLTHKETGEHILNAKRSELLSLEREYQCRVLIFVRAEMDRGADEVQFLSKGDLLAEITDRLPAREEPRRGAARKRGRKKKRGGETAAAAAALAAAAEAEGETERGEEGDGKRRRRRKRRDEPRPERAERAERGERGERPEREAQPEAEERSVDGVTFTGRPSPEALAKIREAARARRAAREAQRPGGTPGASAGDSSDRPQPVAADPGVPPARSAAPSEPVEMPAAIAPPPPAAASGLAAQPATSVGAEAEPPRGIFSRLFGGAKVEDNEEGS
ncbi:MAG: Rne/Rng family ribonuclease [Deltaproteobacteria bacterium]|nr:Rne/Rng family ribonuclease [Deltaproteobacteria bacterium]